MGINNIGKLFYKEYYEGVNFNYVLSGGEGPSRTEVNKKIKSSELIEINNEVATSRLMATVLYPGLLTGTGLVHDSKGIPGGYNLGMHFDYTFGMPVVYGSSVKGVLHAYFKEFCLDCEELNVNPGDAEDLYRAIFKGEVRDKNGLTDKKGNPIYVNLPIYERDIFFDAVVVKAYRDNHNKLHLLEDDSITPHTSGPLKDPIPIAMLKVAPGCKLEFRFMLHDSTINNRTYTVKDKEKIFRKILETVGVGAKTNVGYGQLKFE